MTVVNSNNTKLLYQNTNISIYGFPNITNTFINGIIGQSKSGKTLLLKILAGKIIPKIYFGKASILFKDEQDISNGKNISVLNHLINKCINKKTILHCHSCINNMLERNMLSLSNAEYQILNVWIMCNTISDVYFFDNPFLYLDLYQSLFIAQQIKKLNNNFNYVFVTDNDLTLMKYLCDNIINLNHDIKRKTTYINSMTMINIIKNLKDNLLFIPSYNKNLDPLENGTKFFTYDACKINNIHIDKGFIYLRETVNIIIGQSQSGKTFFMHWLDTKINIDKSIKNQNLKCPWYTGTVINTLWKHLKNKMHNVQFIKQILKPLNIYSLYNKKNKNLTLQEKQLIEIVICLGKNASIYMLDNVTNYLDYIMRVNVAKVIITFATIQKKCVIVIDNDLLFCSIINNNINSNFYLTNIIDNKQIYIKGPEKYSKIIHCLNHVKFD